MENLSFLDELDGKHIVVALGEAFKKRVLLSDLENDSLMNLFLKVYVKKVFPQAKTALSIGKIILDLSVQEKTCFIDNVCNSFALFLFKNTPPELKKEKYRKEDLDAIFEYHLVKLQKFSIDQFEKLIEKSLGFTVKLIEMLNKTKQQYLKVMNEPYRSKALKMDENHRGIFTVYKSPMLDIKSIMFSEISSETIKSFVSSSVSRETLSGKNANDLYPYSSLPIVVKNRDFVSEEKNMAGFLDLLKYNEFSETYISLAEKLMMPDLLEFFPMNKEISVKRYGESFYYKASERESSDISEKIFPKFAFELFLSLRLRPNGFPRDNLHDDFVSFAIDYDAFSKNIEKEISKDLPEVDKSIEFSEENLLAFLKDKFSDSPLYAMLNIKDKISLHFDKEKKLYYFSYINFENRIFLSPRFKNGKICALYVDFNNRIQGSYSVLENGSVLIEEKEHVFHSSLKKLYKEVLDNSQFWQKIKIEIDISDLEESLFLDLIIIESAKVHKGFSSHASYYEDFLNSFSIADFYTNEEFVKEQNALFAKVDSLDSKFSVDLIPVVDVLKSDLFASGNLSFFSRKNISPNVINNIPEENVLKTFPDFPLDLDYYNYFFGESSKNVYSFLKLLSDAVSVEDIQKEIDLLNSKSLADINNRMIEIYVFNELLERLSKGASVKTVCEFLRNTGLSLLKNSFSDNLSDSQSNELQETLFKLISSKIHFYETSLSGNLELISKCTGLSLEQLSREKGSSVRFPEIEFAMKLAYMYKYLFDDEFVLLKMRVVFDKYLTYAKKQKYYNKMLTKFDEMDFEHELSKDIEIKGGGFDFKPLVKNDVDNLSKRFELIKFLKLIQSFSLTDVYKKEFIEFVEENKILVGEYLKKLRENNSINFFVELLVENEVFFDSKFICDFVANYLEDYVKYQTVTFNGLKKYCKRNVDSKNMGIETNDNDDRLKKDTISRLEDVLLILIKFKAFEFVLETKYMKTDILLTELEKLNLENFLKKTPYTFTKLIDLYIQAVNQYINSNCSNTRTTNPKAYYLN